MKVWKYHLDRDYAYPLGIRLPSPVRFHDEQGRHWADIGMDGTLTIQAGYRWNGCDPKIRIGDTIWGTSDGVPDPVTNKPKTYWASLVHDVLCQFQRDREMPLTRAQIDIVFYDILRRDGFAQALHYYYVVRWLGRPYRWLSFAFQVAVRYLSWRKQR